MQARLGALNRDPGVLSLTLKLGVPIVSTGTPLTLTGFRNGVNGRRITTRVSHKISGSGYFTRIEAESPTRGCVGILMLRHRDLSDSLQRCRVIND